MSGRRYHERKGVPTGVTMRGKGYHERNGGNMRGRGNHERKGEP